MTRPGDIDLIQLVHDVNAALGPDLTIAAAILFLGAVTYVAAKVL